MTRPIAQPSTGRIWLLDIDGTLMPSQDLDNRCYWRAVHDIVGGAPEPLVLDEFPDVTDAGILDSWMRRIHGRAPTAPETARIRARFLEILSATSPKFHHAFRPTPGLERWLDRVRADATACVGLATGGWGHSARFKLEAAGLDRYDLAMASSDDSHRRIEIMSIARRRALAERGTGPAEAASMTTIYIGDGPWDFAAARELGWEFIGIAHGPRAERLSAAGARVVVPDFDSLATVASESTRRSRHGSRAVS